MSLEEYWSKRDFSKTGEPKGRLAGRREGARLLFGALRFVVQKHQARQLHYDLRLELGGVLKSWAVPKGPSLNPTEKRLAIRTEDHPIEYRNFEGAIPEDEYGAGTVMLWDEGEYSAPGIEDPAAGEKALLEGLERGRIEFVLRGERLKGAFRLVRLQTGQKDSWLLIKKPDEHARNTDNPAEDRSVRTGRTMEEIRRDSGGTASRLHMDEVQEKVREVERPALAADTDLSGAEQAPMPSQAQPMQATWIEEPFDDPDWLFEIDWEGVRAVAHILPGEIRLAGRNGRNLIQDFPPLEQDLRRIGFTGIVDGVAAVLDDEGRARFELLNRFRQNGEGILVYYIFDLLYMDGLDLRPLPLMRRKQILRHALPDLPRLKFSDHIEEQGTALFEQVEAAGAAGTVAKAKNSLYRVGAKSREWLRVAAYPQQAAVVGGVINFSEQPRIDALLVGAYSGGEFTYTGSVSAGIDAAARQALAALLAPITRSSSPFHKKPKTNRPAAWVDPQIVCEIRHAGWTGEVIMEQPVYLGIREDIDPQQVERDRPIPVAEALRRRRYYRRERPKDSILVSDQAVRISSLEKLFWPESGITKRELIEYYRSIAPFLLPYIKDRPALLHRFPDGIDSRGFFQLDIESAPEWVRRVQVAVPGEGEEESEPDRYLICQDEPTLVYLAQMGCLEIAPWSSRLGTLDNPDYLVIPLEAGVGSFNEVIHTARVFHNVLDRIEAGNYIKTTGGSGLQIFIPMGTQYSYQQTRQFASLICQIVNQILPERTSFGEPVEAQKRKIILDPSQNRLGEGFLAPYSPRPLPGAPVSTPLAWSEVERGLAPIQFSLRVILSRMEKTGDLWQGVLGPGIDMPKCLEALQVSWNEIIEAETGSGKPRG